MMGRRRWVIVCAFAAGAVLVAAGRLWERRGDGGLGIAASGRPTEPGAEGQMAAGLLREGWLHLRHHRYRSAMEAAGLADFFGDDRAMELRLAVRRRQTDAAAALREEMRDVEAAGDARRAERLRELLLRLGAAEAP